MQDAIIRNRKMLPVYFALFLLVVFAVLFLITFIGLSKNEGSVAEADLTSDTYMDVVSLLLERAVPENAPDLLHQYACLGCHREGGIAQLFRGLADVADERHPPLTAPAYIYESIIYPQAHTVEDMQAVMPHLFHAPIIQNGELAPADGDSEQDIQDLADIIAFLLSGASP